MCGNKGGGSPPVPGSQSTAFQSATAPSAFAKPLYEQYLAGAQGLAQTPFNPAMMGTAAPMDPMQTQAGNQLFNLGLEAGTFGSTLGNFDPAKVQEIMSPFTEEVVGATQDWFNNQNAIQGNQLMSGAIRAGNAFGGDRAGVAAAEMAGQQQLAQAPVIAGLRQAGYTQALDEYNKLKQMGLAGRQFGLQGAGAALGWGGQLQQQRQRELDIAQQNAMMASQYPFQLQNWWGSALGGMAPLLGSFSQGYTTPPEPSALQQGVGIATSLVGLAGKLFAKHGGPVGRRARGGLVLIPPSREWGGPVGRARGGLVQSFQWGGSPEQAEDELESLTSGYGGGQEEEPERGAPREREGRPPPTFDIGQVRFPTQGRNALEAAEQRMRQQMEAERQRRTLEEQKGQKQDNSTAGTVASLAGLAVKAAPLLMMMSDRKTKTDVQRVGKTDDGKSLYAFRYRGDPKTYPKVVGPMAKPVKGLQDGGDVDDDDDEDTDNDTDTAVFTASATPVSTPASAPGAGAGAAPDLSGAIESQGTPLVRVPPPVRTVAPVETGNGGGPYPRTMVIPGLGPERRAGLPVWDALIGFGAGLTSRPNWYGGVGAGAVMASNAIDRARRMDLLDQKPQHLGDGRWRVGNKIIDTGIRRAGKLPPEELEALRQKNRLELEEKRQQGRGGGGKPSIAQEEATKRAHANNLERSLRILGDNPDPEKVIATIEGYNARHGTSFPVPARPKAEADTAEGTSTGPGWWSRVWNSLFGSSEPAAATAAPAEPAAKPAAPAQAAPAQTQQAPPRPGNVPAGSAYSPSRNQWRTPDGKLFDANGQPVQ